MAATVAACRSTGQPARNISAGPAVYSHSANSRVVSQYTMSHEAGSGRHAPAVGHRVRSPDDPRRGRMPRVPHDAGGRGTHGDPGPPRHALSDPGAAGRAAGGRRVLTPSPGPRRKAPPVPADHVWASGGRGGGTPTGAPRRRRSAPTSPSGKGRLARYAARNETVVL